MTVRPGLWSNTPSNIGVPTEADLANFGSIARSFPAGVPCYAEDTQTIYIWDPQDITSPTVVGQSVAVIVSAVQIGTWHAVGGGTVLTSALDTVVGGVDSLKSTIPTVNGVTATVKGYYAAGDGGTAPIYFWSSLYAGAANDGTIVRPTAALVGAWFAIFSGALNVRWFGAANSVANNAPLFAAALAALGTPNQGALYVPQDPVGPYKFTTTLTLSGTGFEALRIYGDVGGVTSDRGTRILWNGALSGTAIHVFGATNVFLENLDIDCDSKAKFGWDVEGDTVTPQGTSLVQWTNCNVFSPRDVAGAAGWVFGDATGFQCDNLLWIACLVQGSTAVNPAGWLGRGGGNVKNMTWDQCKFINLKIGLDWQIPSGRNSMRSPDFTSINDTCLLFNEGNLVVESGNTESCTGYLLRSTGGGANSGSVTFIGGQFNTTCNADDMICKWQAGFQSYISCYFRNLRTGASVPNLVVNSGYGYANANNFGLYALGCTFVNAANPYIPVLDEGGVVILTAARLQGGGGPAPIWGLGCLGGPLAGLSKLLPVSGREPDAPQFVQGLMYSSAAGVKSTAPDPIPLPAKTTMQIGGNTVLDLEALTAQLGNATATKFLNLLMANVAACVGIIGTPFTQFKIADPATIEIYANGVRVYRADATGIGLYANATVAQQQVTNNTGNAGAAAQLVDVTTAGLADPAKVNANFAALLVKLQNLGALRN